MFLPLNIPLSNSFYMTYLCLCQQINMQTVSSQAHPNEVRTGISWQGDLTGPIWLFIKLSSVSYLSFHLACKENGNTAGQKKSRELFLSVFGLLLLQPPWRWIALTRRGCTVVRKCWSLLLSQTCATDQAFNDILHQTLPSHPYCHLNVCTTLDCKA